MQDSTTLLAAISAGLPMPLNLWQARDTVIVLLADLQVCLEHQDVLQDPDPLHILHTMP